MRRKHKHGSAVDSVPIAMLMSQISGHRVPLRVREFQIKVGQVRSRAIIRSFKEHPVPSRTDIGNTGRTTQR